MQRIPLCFQQFLVRSASLNGLRIALACGRSDLSSGRRSQSSPGFAENSTLFLANPNSLLVRPRLALLDQKKSEPGFARTKCARGVTRPLGNVISIECSAARFFIHWGSIIEPNWRPRLHAILAAREGMPKQRGIIIALLGSTCARLVPAVDRRGVPPAISRSLPKKRLEPRVSNHSLLHAPPLVVVREALNRRRGNVDLVMIGASRNPFGHEPGCRCSRGEVHEGETVADACAEAAEAQVKTSNTGLAIRSDRRPIGDGGRADTQVARAPTPTTCVPTPTGERSPRPPHPQGRGGCWNRRCIDDIRSASNRAWRPDGQPPARGGAGSRGPRPVVRSRGTYT